MKLKLCLVSFGRLWIRDSTQDVVQSYKEGKERSGSEVVKIEEKCYKISCEPTVTRVLDNLGGYDQQGRYVGGYVEDTPS